MGLWRRTYNVPGIPEQIIVRMYLRYRCGACRVMPI